LEQETANLPNLSRKNVHKQIWSWKLFLCTIGAGICQYAGFEQNLSICKIGVGHCQYNNLEQETDNMQNLGRKLSISRFRVRNCQFAESRAGNCP
jgi:hypothetical protein